MGGKAITFKIALAPETAMYVLIDIIILIHHQEACSRLAKNAGSQLNHQCGKEIQIKKGEQMLSLTVSQDLKNQHPLFSSNSKQTLQSQELIF